MTLASPTLMSFLLRQSRTEQIPFARLLKTSQPRISRVVRGSAELTDDEWQQAALTLALGHQGEAEIPIWIVTRFHASGELDQPAIATDGTLPVFTTYRYARAVVAHLRDIGGIRNAYALPAWPSYVAEQLSQRDPATTQRRFVGTEDESGTTLSEWLPRLVRGFAVEPPRLVSLSSR